MDYDFIFYYGNILNVYSKKYKKKFKLFLKLYLKE